MLKVLKFGGSSVQDAAAASRVIDHINLALVGGDKLVVVVSALAKVTNELTELCWHSYQLHEIDLDSFLALKSRHQLLAAKLIRPANALIHAQQWIERFFGQLEETLTRLINLGLTSDSQDAAHHQSQLAFLMAKALAAGELLSSTILHLALLARGLENKWVDARHLIITDQQWLQATPQHETLYQVPILLNPVLTRFNLVVVPGFIGGTAGGATTLLGREGSDYSAALIAQGLNADELQIWSDVAGVMEMDPRINPKARVVPALSYEQAGELARWGGKILYPNAMHPARLNKIPVKLFNSFDAPGTAKFGTLIDAKDNSDLWAVTSITNPLILLGDRALFSSELLKDLAANDFEYRGILDDGESQSLLIAKDHGRPDGKLKPEDLNWLTRYPGVNFRLDLDLVAVISTNKELVKDFFNNLPVIANLVPEGARFSYLALTPREALLEVLSALYDKRAEIKDKEADENEDQSSDFRGHWRGGPALY